MFHLTGIYVASKRGSRPGSFSINTTHTTEISRKKMKTEPHNV